MEHMQDGICTCMSHTTTCHTTTCHTIVRMDYMMQPHCGMGLSECMQHLFADCILVRYARCVVRQRALLGLSCPDVHVHVYTYIYVYMHISPDQKCIAWPGNIMSHVQQIRIYSQHEMEE